MKKLLDSVRALLSSRAASPVIIGLFLLVYIVIAFETEDALTALIALTSQSLLLQALLALLPVSCAFRLFGAAQSELLRHRARSGAPASLPAGLYEETVQLPAVQALERLQERLDAEGYRTSRGAGYLSARKGVSSFLPRLLLLSAIFCLFAGILISISSRTSHRAPVIEGEPLPTSRGGGGLVKRIDMKNGTGRVLARVLDIQVAASESGEAEQSFGLYPPALHRGYFVYPRYLGFSPMIRFAAPDLPGGFQGPVVLNLYPAGREDRAEIPGSPYRIVFSVAPRADGSDPFVAGTVSFQFKILKGEELLLSGAAPVGGEFAKDGYRLAVLDSRRMVLTDFVKDYGVLLIWTALICFGVAACVWLPLRLLVPGREMLFLQLPDSTRAYSRAEGAGTGHAGVFHEALDLLEAEAGNAAGKCPPKGDVR